MYEPLQRASLREQAYQAIRSRIVRGELAPGSRLGEEHLAEALGVSRAPIKDALLRLERERFVDSDGISRRVKQFTLGELEQAYSVRSVLETMAARLAAERSDVRKEPELRSLLAAHRGAVMAHDVEGFAESDFHLHRAIWDFSGNPCLQSALDCIASSTFQLIVEFTRHNDAIWQTILGQHTSVVEAVIGGDPESAARVMADHIQHAYSVCTSAMGGQPAGRLNANGSAADGRTRSSPVAGNPGEVMD